MADRSAVVQFTQQAFGGGRSMELSGEACQDDQGTGSAQAMVVYLIVPAEKTLTVRKPVGP